MCVFIPDTVRLVYGGGRTLVISSPFTLFIFVPIFLGHASLFFFFLSPLIGSARASSKAYLFSSTNGCPARTGTPEGSPQGASGASGESNML